ncbi:MAG: DEAD/DEAH box helicase [Chitinophagales bacterium]|nr:DEAD/DEAH box helicase [Chitinophagales bacterium]
MLFQQLALIEPILRALEKEGYTNPTSIQQQAIPEILAGKDLLGCAQTGTGKTAAFVIPILQQLHAAKQQKANMQMPKALILTPTRELAIQIGESIAAYGKYLSLKHVVVFGGVSQHAQVQQIQRGAEIVVATPGRLIDLIQQGLVSIAHINHFVLDEADRMLDMGFIHDIKRVITYLPEQRQTLFFSATMPPEIQHLTQKLLTNPIKVTVAPVSSTVDRIDQSVYHIAKHQKLPLLIQLLDNTQINSLLVFTQMKHAANKLAKKLSEAGIAADAIHGNKSQNARQLALSNFKKGRIRVLVATDIAARGIDIDELGHVLNFDLPAVPETYVHRIGRTGRAGFSGSAISFCDPEEKNFLTSIEKLIQKRIPTSAHGFQGNAQMRQQTNTVSSFTNVKKFMPVQSNKQKTQLHGRILEQA